MNLYTCSIDIHDGTKALAFAKAVHDWMDKLKSDGVIGGWTLYRRKLALASDSHRDFLLQIEVDDLSQLDQAFRKLGCQDEDIEALYQAVHSRIAVSDVGLYRPFPDPENAERMALI